MLPLPRAALPALLVVLGCANSTSPPGTGRGGADGGGRAADAGGDPTDGGSADGAAGGRDAGPTESCTPGSEGFCATSCGTSGTRACEEDGTYGPCEPPPEDCNGIDDDCDGVPDDGVGTRPCSSECGGGSETCVDGSWSGCTAVSPSGETCDGEDEDCDSLVDEGLTRGCTTACGSGTETCNVGSWIDCTAPAPAPETCNSIDDDCDGTVDEGFRTAVEMTTYGVLAAEHADCDGTSQRMGAACNAAIHRFCADRACVDSGFGPVENSGTTAYVTCVAADVRSTDFATLASHHPSCDGSTESLGPSCNAAVHRYCQARSALSGFGPVENGAGSVTVACLPTGRGEVRATSYTALSAEHGPCDGTTQRWGTDCNAAIHRWCRDQGFDSGFGPVENSGDTAHVVCVDA